MTYSNSQREIMTKMYAAKLEREGAEFRLNLHRETCEKCDAATIDRIRKGGGCSEGVTLADAIYLANERVRGLSGI